jgi:hypothetical protein
MTTQKNGIAAPTNGKKIETTVTLVPAADKNLQVSKQVSEPGPLEDRLFRINQLFDLQNRYTRLLKSGQKLEEFKIKKGEENISLSISDDSTRGLEFTTSNPEVIKEVLVFVRDTIIKKRKEVEDQLILS